MNYSMDKNPENEEEALYQGLKINLRSFRIQQSHYLEDRRRRLKA